MPQIAMEAAAQPDRRTNLRSVSMPVSSSSIKMPICDRPSIMPFCAASGGKRNLCASGHTQPNSDGPSTMPASKVPIRAG